MSATGGCLCGKIRYTLKAEPALTVVCHCTHCQKASGSAFSTNLVIQRADIDFISPSSLTQGWAERVHICIVGLTTEGSSSVPAFRTADPGRPLDSLMIEAPHFGQNERLSVLPLSAVSS